MPVGPLLDPPPLVFRDVSAEAGLPRATRECMALRDFDGDGAPDILLSPLSADEKSASLALYLNRRDGTFEPFDIPTDVQKYRGCSVADYDGDGLLDIALIDGADGRLLLLHHKSSSPPTFEIDAAHPTVGTPDAQRLTVTFVDVDSDGWPDLYVATSQVVATDGGAKIAGCKVTTDDIACTMKNDPEPGRPRIYHNDRGHGFVPSTMIVPGPHGPWPWGVSAVDWDEDGSVDLFLSHDFSYNQFLHNVDGKLSDMLPALGASVYNHGMGAAFADYNHDGRWDFWVADLGPDQVWISGPNGIKDEAKALGVEAATWARMHWGPVAVDFNNDGFDDLFSGNEMIGSSAEDLADKVASESPGALDMVDDVFVNVRGERFIHQDVPFPMVHNRVQAINSVGDYDGDGRIDVLEGPGPLRLLRNETTLDPSASHWIDVRLHGARSPVNAHGAVLSIEVDGAPAGRRAAESHDGRGNSSDVLHFGLGTATRVSAIRILWPGGRVEVLPGPIEADQLIEMTQP